MIALLGSYMICREEQEDTLKSLRLIPVDEMKLTLSQFIWHLGKSSTEAGRKREFDRRRCDEKEGQTPRRKVGEISTRD